MSNLRFAAALMALAMPAVGSNVEVLSRPAYSTATPNTRPWAPRAGRIRTPGTHQPAGSKLWRKAKEGKLGLRW